MTQVAVILEITNSGVPYISEVYASYEAAKARVEELKQDWRDKLGVCYSDYLVVVREVIE